MTGDAGDSSTRVCEEGHPVGPDDAFCRTCGSPATVVRGQEPPGGTGRPDAEDGTRDDDGRQVDQRSRLGARDRTLGRLPKVIIGLIGGGVAFGGFFVDFLNTGGSSLASASSGWFDLVPIFVGLSVLAFFLPRFGFVFSGLSLISLGVTFGFRGLISGLHASGGTGYGTGFWMVTVGSGVLALAWMAEMVTSCSVTSARPESGVPGGNAD